MYQGKGLPYLAVNIFFILIPPPLENANQDRKFNLPVSENWLAGAVAAAPLSAIKSRI